jgi:hypothetical protein
MDAFKTSLLCQRDSRVQLNPVCSQPQDCPEWVIFGNDGARPANTGPPSKAEGPAREVSESVAAPVPVPTAGPLIAADGLRRSFRPGRHLSAGQHRNNALRRPAGFTVDASDMLWGRSAGPTVKGHPRACGVYGDRSTSTDIPSTSP